MDRKKLLGHVLTVVVGGVGVAQVLVYFATGRGMSLAIGIVLLALFVMRIVVTVRARGAGRER